MESTKNRKKGLLSIVSLIVCLAMLTVGTYAWFTDTATVSGNKVTAGNLDVAVVMTGKEIKDKVTGVTLPTTKGNQIGSDGGDYEGATLVKEGSDSANQSDYYYDVSGLEVPLFALGNVEPGQVKPVSMKVMNTGDLAIGFTAGFKLPKRGGTGADKDMPTSYTGLETLELQHADSDFIGYYKTREASGNAYAAAVLQDSELPNDIYAARLANLLEKQWTEKDRATAEATYGANRTKLYSTAYNAGGYLENALEVYAVSEAELADPTYFTAAGEATAKAGQLCDPAHLIGTVKDIISANDVTYIPSTVPDKDTDGDGIADQSEAQRVAAAKDALAKFSAGYCLPTAALPSGGTVNVTIKADPDDPTAPVWTKNDVNDIGKVTYLIKMSEDADNIYQNAYISFDAGVTANQVKWETDGTGSYLYDPNPDFATPAP